MNIGTLGEAWVRSEPERTAIIDRRLEVSITYRDLHERADSLTQWLLSVDFMPSEWAILIARNRCEFFELLLAVARCGGALYPLNWRLAPKAMSDTVEALQPRIIFAEEAFADAAHQIAADTAALVVLIPPNFARPSGDGAITTPARFGERPAPSADIVEYESCLSRHPSRGYIHPTHPSDPVLAVHTGGTTGSVKGAIHSHAGLLAAFLNNGSVESIRPDDRYLVMGQLFHSAAILALNYLLRGATVVLFDYSPERAIDVIMAERVTATLVFPSMVRAIIGRPDAESALAQLRSIQYGGGGFLPADIERLRDVNAGALLHCYGTSESVGVTFLTGDEHTRAQASGDGELLKSCGREAVLAAVRILGTDGQTVPADGEAVGEIHVKSASNMLQYVGGEQTYGPHRWIPTGDLAYRRSDGYVFIVGRSKEVIRCGGENLYPRQIEQVVATLPNVADVAIIGCPDDQWGEAPIAFVVAERGVQAPSLSEIQEKVRRVLGSYQKPHALVLRDALPVSAAGKADRSTLREEYISPDP